METLEATQEIVAISGVSIFVPAFCDLSGGLLLCVQPGERRTAEPSRCDGSSLVSGAQLFRNQFNLRTGAFLRLGQLSAGLAIVDYKRVVLAQL